VLTGQLSVGWSNDWIDAARDVAAGRDDKPVVAGDVSAAGLRTAALGAAAACVPLSLACGWLAGAVHLAAVALAWAYNLRLKATAWSWVPYAGAFGLLPAFAVLAAPGRPAPAAWVPVAGALLGVGAHLVNALPDLDDDAATGVRGLPHRLGRRGVAAVAPVVLLAGVVCALVGLRASGAVPAAGLVLAGALALVLAALAGVVAARTPHSRAPFGLSMGVAAVCVALLVGAGTSLRAG
jgi:4-hydroxybenzoate polyprenyltransferase